MKRKNLLLGSVLCALTMCMVLWGGVADRAYADSSLQTGDTDDSAVTEQATTGDSNVRYVAIIGADSWYDANGNFLDPRSDLQLVVRMDFDTGTVNILSIPRDIQYDGNTSIDKSAVYLKSNYAFYYAYRKTIKEDRSNYGAAIKAGAKATCKMIKKVTGISVSDYAVVDLYTYQDIIDMLGGVTVDIPVAIKDYRLYSDRNYYSVNGGKTGTTTLDAWDAMIASRTRETYCRWTEAEGYNIKYAKKSEYKGDYPQLLIKKENSAGKVTDKYWHFDGDGTRQFLNRRTLTALMLKGLNRPEGAVSFVWDSLVSGGLLWTNLDKSDVTAIVKGLTKAKSANKLVVYGASVISPVRGAQYNINGADQYLFKLDKKYKAQIKSTVAQFKAGEPMTAGWGDETILGIAKGTTKKASGITYKAISNTSVAVVKAPNKKNVMIPATVKLNGKVYKVTKTLAGSFKGAKIRNVVLGANVSTIAAGTFKGSKATKVTIKSQKLVKKKVKGSLKASVVKTVVVAKAKYKSYFSKSNAGWSKKPKLVVKGT